MSIVRLRVPVLTMILAATAIPVAFRPLQQAESLLLSIDTYDIVANIACFVPLGIVLAALGPLRAVMAAALLSMFAETSQLVMLYRDPSLIDVATNVLGAILGVIVVARYKIKPQFTATRWIGTVAAALSLLLILDVWKMSGNWPSDRGTTTPGTGTLEAHWTFDEGSDRVALDFIWAWPERRIPQRTEASGWPDGQRREVRWKGGLYRHWPPHGSAAHQQYDD